MDEEIKIRCKGCGNKFLPSEMGHDVTNSILCKNCLKKGAPIKPRTVERSKPSIPKGAVKYICNACNYKFYRVPGSRQNERCPYCSSPNISPDKSDAQNLIEEVDKFNDDKFFKA